jgi:hypothetical protein
LQSKFPMRRIRGGQIPRRLPQLMCCKRYNLKLQINRILAASFGCVLLALFSAPALASIEMPDMPTIESVTYEMGAGASEASDDSDYSSDSSDGKQATPLEFALPTSPISGGATGTSTSTTVSPGPSVAIGHCDCCLPPLDLDLLEWVTGDTDLNLPEAPGNDLLRPPRY